MALTQVNQDPGSPPKKSKLEYFSQGLDMAQSVAGLANSFKGLSAKPGAGGLVGQAPKTALEKYNLGVNTEDPFKMKGYKY